MMCKLARWACATAFVLICCGVLAFMNIFSQSDPSFSYPSWEYAAVVSPSGAETPFDPTGLPPQLEEGEHYRFSLTLPEDRLDSIMLVFETTNLDVAVFLDDQEIWYSASTQDASSIGLSQTQLPLPPGGGETLTMDVLSTGETGLFPPLPRLTTDPTDQEGTIAYANLYGIPAGAMSLAFVFIVGLFLLGMANGQPDPRLILLGLAAACLVVDQLNLGFGTYFLPSIVQEAFSGPVTEVFPIIACVVWIALHRDRAFWKTLGMFVAWTVVALLAASSLAFAIAPDGRFANYLTGFYSEVQSGIVTNLFFWLTLWLVLCCSFLSAWDLARTFAQGEADRKALALRNQLIMDNYHAIEERLEQDGAKRHEFTHRLTAIGALAEAGDLKEIRRCVSDWREEGERESTTRYTKNPVVNAIIQDAAARAGHAGTHFSAHVIIPEELPIATEDLCSLLMNMLDNAIEATERLGEQGHIRITMGVAQGHLTVHCENSFDGTVLVDDRGNPRTTKQDRSAHGFGLALMRSIAEKYGSVLDVSWTEDTFTVQTALRLQGAGA